MAPSAAPSAAQSAAASANGTANAAGFAKTQPAASARAAGANLDVAAMLSEAARTRPPSAIRSLFPAELLPGMLSFLAGKPNPQTFPISAITLTVAPTPGASAPVDVPISGAALAAGMQYGPTNGIRELNDWLVSWQERIHRRTAPAAGATARPGAGLWRVTIGQGSQDLLTKTFTALLNPGDSVLVESPAYTGILPQLSTLKANLAPVASDAEGMCPKSLRSILAGWHTSPATRSHPFPKFVYTTPTGANPAGTTASEQRKREVLAVVREYGVLLLEDDPYIFLGFEGLGEDPVTRDRGRSYFSLETDGREQSGDGFVARFDSFSKIIGGGLRIGVLTGPTALVDAVDLDTSSANLQPSGVAQAILLALLQHWGQDGLLQHVDRVASFYRDRRDAFEQRAHEILGSQGGQKAVAEWVKPVAGMFLWLRLKLPPAKGAPDGDSFALISEKAKAAGVLAVPGVAFMPDGSKTPYVRTSFSIIDEEDVAEAMRRLRSVVENAWAEQGLELP